MKTFVFGNPPFVELIAEVRWQLPPQSLAVSGVLPANVPMPVAPVTASKHEELFMKYGVRISTHGYNQATRLVPQGFPMMSYHPVYRFVTNEPGTLYQLGAGVFTANATKPYKTWKEFAPLVRNGLDALFASLDQPSRENVRQVSLRYIDGFTGDLQASQLIWKFVNDTLGIKIHLPESLTQICTNINNIKPTLQFSIPVNIGTLAINIGEGTINNESSYIMDTTITSQQTGVTDVDTIMMLLNTGHEIIDKLFVSLTRPLHTIMQPM